MAKILVIDDDPAIVDLLRFRLEELGHQVCVAMDAAGGLMQAAREKPDLITLDFKMPAGDGAKLYARLRVNNITAKMKVIFISGMSEADLERSIPKGPDIRFLPKPIDMDLLRRQVAELLGGPVPPAPPPAGI